MRTLLLLAMAGLSYPTLGQTTVTISGTFIANGAPVSGVTIPSGVASCTASNALGQYSCTVPQGFTGTLAPAGGGFTPSFRSYTNVTANQSGQDYVSGNPTISGTVTVSGVPASGVPISGGGGANCSPSTNASGQYSCTVPSGYTGTITPIGGGFTPVNRSYSNVILNQTGQDYSSGTPGAGPVGQWRFEEGSGGVAADSSGNGNVGTLRNGASWTAGQQGGALQFDGVAQDVMVADSPSLSITGTGLTLAAWIYPTAGSNGAVIHKEQHFSLLRNADGSLTYADSATWSYATIGNYGSTPLNTWSHVAVTFDGSAIRFYINGALASTVNRVGALTDNANPLYLGSYDGTYHKFTGKLDEAHVFGRTLSAAEVVTLADPAQGQTTVTISGTFIANGAPASGVGIAGGGATCTVSNAQGQYSCTVPQGFTGTLAPAGGGFTPSFRSYSNVTANQSGQDYVSGNPSISGTIIVNGLPASGVVVAGGGATCTSSNASGQYSCSVPQSFTGTLTPLGGSFTPASRSYTNVTLNQTAQDYSSGVPNFTISGTITVSGGPANGVALTSSQGTCTPSNALGQYSCMVQQGFTGTIAPVGGVFTPNFRSYSNVTANQGAQDYTMVPPAVSIAAPANGTMLAPPATVNLLAAVTGSVQWVEFYRNGTLINTTGAIAPYSYSDTNLASGTYNYTAKAYANLGNLVANSLAVTVVVNAPPLVSITSPFNGAVVASPGTVNLIASAVDTDGTISKVEYYRGPTLIATTTVAPYSFSDINVPLGNYSYTARAYDNSGSITTSAPVTVVVNTAPTVSITAPANNAMITTPAPVNLTAVAADSDGTITKVEFYRGSTLINTATATPYSYSDTAVTAGTYNYTATAYDNAGLITTSTAVTVVVNAPPTASIATTGGGTVFQPPATIGLVATAADPDGTISKVEFYRNGTLINTTGAAAPYNYVDTGVGVGTYSYTAKAYDNRGAVTTSSPMAVIVNAAPTVAITSPVSGTAFAAPATVVTFTVSTSDSDGYITQLELYRGATLVQTQNAPSNLTDTSGLLAGSYIYTVKAYDNNGGVTTSAPVTVVVSAAPTVSITSPQNPLQSPNAPLFLAATAADSDGTITKVEFYRGATLIGTDTTVPYSVVDPGVPSGTYSYTAKAYDNSGLVTTSAALIVIMNAVPTVTLTAPVTGSRYAPPATVPLQAIATDSDGTIAKVEFYRGAALINTTTTYPYQYLDLSVPSGAYTYSAKAYDNTGNITNSAVVNVVVNASPTVSITAPVNGTVVTAPVSLLAVATDADGTVSKVEFYRDGNWISTRTAAPYNFTDVSVTTGTHTYTATAYDNSGNITSSAAVSVTVNIAPSVTITSPVNGVLIAAPATVNLTATAADSDGTITKVEFYRGATLINTDITAPYSFSDTGVATGTYSYTAKAYDNQGAVATSTAVTVVSNAAPTASITAPANNTIITAPAPVNLTATAADTDGTITKVEFYRGATLISTDTTAPYSFSDTGMVAGTYSYTAKAYDNSGNITTSAAITVIVNAPPTVSLTAPANNTIFSPPATVNLVASAADSDGTITKVEFYRGATLINTDTTAPYSFSNTGVTAGTYSYTARAYDDRGAVTTSAAVAIVVNAPPTVSITAPANNTVINAPATVNLTATATDPGGTITKVEFYRGATLINTDTTSPYSFSDTGVAAGTYSYTAKTYDNSGNITTSAAITVIVNALPTVSLTAPTNNTVLAPPATVNLAATAADSDGTITKVEFYRGATLINTDTTAPYSFSNTGVAAGTYSYTAKAYDNRGAITTSAAVTVVVGFVPTVSLTAPANNTVLAPPATVNLAATAADSDGTITKVEFYRGATLINIDTTAPYSFSDTGVAAGTYNYTAKTYDNSGNITTSTAITVVVNVPPTISITAPVNNTTLTPPATVNLAATASDSDGTITKVEFYRGATLINTDATVPYSFSDTGVAAGTYSYTAKAYDNSGNITTSTAVTVVVNALPTVSISASSAVVQLGQTVQITATPSDPDSPVRKVEFYRGATLIGTVSAVPYTMTVSGLTANSYAFTVKAYDDQNALGTSAPVNVIVNAPPTVTLTAPANNMVIAAPATLTLTTNAADSDGTITSVQFYNGATPVGTATAAPFNLTLTNLPAGPYRFTARAFDNNGGVTTSGVINVTVGGNTTAAPVIYQYDELGRLIGVQH